MSTSGTTTAGLKTPNVAAITSPGTWPSTEPRLQKYAGPSGIATPPTSAGLGEKPERGVGLVTLGREVHLTGQRLDGATQRAGPCAHNLVSDHAASVPARVPMRQTVGYVRGMGTAPGTAGEITVTIEGYDLPGRHCDPHDTDAVYEDVHVGVQRRKEVVDLVPGDAPSARWTFDVTTKIADDGTLDFGGPYVHGRRGDRFLYLSWGAGADGHHMFRRAKLNFADCDPTVIAAALRSGTVTVRVNLSDRWGQPRCARVKPPDASWSSPSPG